MGRHPQFDFSKLQTISFPQYSNDLRLLPLRLYSHWDPSQLLINLSYLCFHSLLVLSRWNTLLPVNINWNNQVSYTQTYTFFWCYWMITEGRDWDRDPGSTFSLKLPGHFISLSLSFLLAMTPCNSWQIIASGTLPVMIILHRKRMTLSALMFQLNDS